MNSNTHRNSQITLQTPGGESFVVSVLDIQSLVSLSPFITDLLLKSGDVIPVEGNLEEVLNMIQQSSHPVFKDLKMDKDVNKVLNLDLYRKINYGT
jgi:hypothetical protein